VRLDQTVPGAADMTVLEGERRRGLDRAPEARRQRLIGIIRARSLARATRVKLTSGAESSFYFDMKPTMFDPEGAALVAHLMLEELRRDGAEVVGGLEMGAVPIVACIVQLSFLTSDLPGVQGFFVRKAAKAHGTRKLIEGVAEGTSLAGRRAVIVEDVTTTGTSALTAVAAAREAGLEVGTVVTIVDRLEGAEANFSRHQLELRALTTARDFEIGG
jgi:orotate phosphoribosyltransferase